MKAVFLFRSLPDVDHMAPVAWKLLREGHEVVGLVSPGYDADGDYRLRHLQGEERFRLVPIRGRARMLLPVALGWLARARPDVLVVEWGEGPREAYDRRASVAALRAFVRDTGASLLIPTPVQLRFTFVAAARILRVPTVHLPHGLNIKLTTATTAENEAALRSGAMDWRDRNRAAAYVLNTEHHRRWHLEHAMGDPEVMQTWGSVRWSPEWVAVNRELVPSFAWPAEAEGRLKVVFMVPKWAKKVDAPAVIELVARLQDLEGVALAVKGHPRPEDGAADPLRADPRIDWSRIVDATRAESVALIAASDVVIDVGSSIGVETVLQRRVLVNPAYVHAIRTLFDEIDGSCVRALSADEVVAYLEDHRDGRPRPAEPSAVDELLRRAVYGEREPFDVLGLYSRRLRELAEVTT